MPQLSLLEKQVLLTISYCDQFQYPLTKREVWSRLLLPLSSRVDLPYLSLKSIEGALTSLKKKKLITEYQAFFCLDRKDIKEFAQYRTTRRVFSRQKFLEATQVVRFARHIPWIQAIFLTGSVAVKNAEKDSDIDFLFVVSPNRVWLSRLVINIFAQLKKKRRSWHGEEKNSWCFNLWLDTEKLGVQEEKRGVYRAYEVIQAAPLFDRSVIVPFFDYRNNWVKRYLGNWRGKATTKNVSSSLQVRHSIFLDMLDWMAWKAQLWYMARHRTSEQVERTAAFFHPRDTEGIIYDGWKTSLCKVLIAEEADKILHDYVITRVKK